MSFRIGGSVVNIGDGLHGALELLLFKRSTEAIDAGNAVHPERAGAVLHGVLIGEDQDWWSG